MTRTELADQILNSRIFSQWHWFQYHFNHELNGDGHPLARGIIEAALECERRMPGYACELVKRLSALSGREKHLPDWEQLLSILAELHVISQIARWSWPKDTSFTWEPRAPGSNRNPEIAVRTGEQLFAYEVKAPTLFTHQAHRRSNSIQIAARLPNSDAILDMINHTGPVTLPRDNPVKDFLISAEGKFRPFKDAYEQFTGILVICWDDFVYEPTNALTHPHSGLLTDKSFYQSPQGTAVQFPSVGGVVLLRHLHQLVRSCRDQPLLDDLIHPFDYGAVASFPWKAFHQNPIAPPVPELAIECLDARPPDQRMGPEYFPNELVMWLG